MLDKQVSPVQGGVVFSWIAAVLAVVSAGVWFFSATLQLNFVLIEQREASAESIRALTSFQNPRLAIEERIEALLSEGARQATFNSEQEQRAEQSAWTNGIAAILTGAAALFGAAALPGSRGSANYAAKAIAECESEIAAIKEPLMRLRLQNPEEVLIMAHENRLTSVEAKLSRLQHLHEHLK